MNVRLLKSFCALATLAGALALTTERNAVAQSSHEAANAGFLVGTWSVQVQLVDCTSGTQLGLPFWSLLTFARGGTLTETTANPNFFPTERGPGHGFWIANKRGYTAASTAFITLSGVLQTTQVIRQSIHVGATPDTFESTATTEISDLSGNVIKSGCATATATRFK
jgi:hypothetical protein